MRRDGRSCRQGGESISNVERGQDLGWSKNAKPWSLLAQNAQGWREAGAAWPKREAQNQAKKPSQKIPPTREKE